jgi:hypothetical protein
MEMGGPCDTYGEQKSLQGFSVETLDVLGVGGSIILKWVLTK